jgi:hypothetical protein
MSVGVMEDYKLKDLQIALTELLIPRGGCRDRFRWTYLIAFEWIALSTFVSLNSGHRW